MSDELAKRESLQVGQKIKVVITSGIQTGATPMWCHNWIGRIIRLNKLTATVEFEVNEKNQDTVRRYIDYCDIREFDE